MQHKITSLELSVHILSALKAHQLDYSRPLLSVLAQTRRHDLYQVLGGGGGGGGYSQHYIRDRELQSNNGEDTF